MSAEEGRGLLLDLVRTWTPQQAAAKIGTDWMRPDVVAEPWESNRGAFWTGLHEAVRAGLVEIRTVQHARHATTGETRTFYSTDNDYPARFSCQGMAASKGAPWYACGSYAEWRRITPATREAA